MRRMAFDSAPMRLIARDSPGPPRGPSSEPIQTLKIARPLAFFPGQILPGVGDILVLSDKGATTLFRVDAHSHAGVLEVYLGMDLEDLTILQICKTVLGGKCRSLMRRDVQKITEYEVRID